MIFGKIISKSSCAKFVQYVRLEVKTFFNFFFVWAHEKRFFFASFTVPVLKRSANSIRKN